MGKKDARRLENLRQLAAQNPEDEVMATTAAMAAARLPAQRRRQDAAVEESAFDEIRRDEMAAAAMVAKEEGRKAGQKQSRAAAAEQGSRKEKAAVKPPPAESDDEDSDEENNAQDEEEAAEINGRNLTLHFDLGSMQASDENAVNDFMDRALFDNFVAKDTGAFIYCDREDLAAALLETPMTSVIQVAQSDGEGSDDEEDEEGEEGKDGEAGEATENDVFGVMSILDVARRSAEHPSLATLRDLLGRPPLAVVHRGGSVKDLLVNPRSDEPSRAVVLINDHMPTIPPEVAIQQVQFTLNSAAEHMMEQLEKKNPKKISKILYADPSSTILVVLAKVQRQRQVEETTANKQSKKKQRREGEASTTRSGFNLEDFVFLRGEDEILYKKRDERVGVSAHRFQPEHDRQPESEVPVCIVFGIRYDQALSAFSFEEDEGEELE